MVTLHAENFFRILCLLSADCFSNFLSGIPSVSQTIWIQFRREILTGLIWAGADPRFLEIRIIYRKVWGGLTLLILSLIIFLKYPMKVK